MTSNKSKIKRFYYPTGLISLMLLPVLCIWNLHSHHAFEQYRVMEICWWNPSLHTNDPDFFPKESHPNKNYTDINLTGNDQTDKIKLDSAQLLIRELVASQDTSTGVHFRFSDKSKYWTLIRAIEICKIEKAIVYIPYKNEIWVLNPKPKLSTVDKPKMLRCGTGSLINCIPYVKTDQELEEERNEKIKFIVDNTKTYFVSGLLFIL